MGDKRPAIEVIEAMWRETTSSPMPASLRNTVENLLIDVWVEGFKEGRVHGWNENEVGFEL